MSWLATGRFPFRLLLFVPVPIQAVILGEDGFLRRLGICLAVEQSLQTLHLIFQLVQPIRLQPDRLGLLPDRYIAWVEGGFVFVRHASRLAESPKL